MGILRDDLFGDQVSSYSGSLEFVVTDVALEGNNTLSVSMGRRFTVESRGLHQAPKLMSDWELEIPHLSGVFPAKNGSANGWQVSTYQQPDRRCDVDSPLTAMPPDALAPQGGIFTSGEYWHGNNLYVPGQGSQELMVIDPHSGYRPTDGAAYRWVTANQWYFSCLSTTANGVPGEAFLARAPDGTRYWFNWFAKRPYATVTKPNGAGPIDFSMQANAVVQPLAATNSLLAREEIWLLPTRVEDRFGNYVTYTYDPANPWRVTSIIASDGRSLRFSYNSSGFIGSVTDQYRTWQYIYDNAGLAQVTLPDASKWSFDLAGLRSAYVTHSQSGPAHCGESAHVPGSYTGTMMHPAGATGAFTVTVLTQGRSYVPKFCVFTGPGAREGPYAMYPRRFDTLAISRKTLQGSGLAPMTWTYDYGATNASWLEDCASGCASTRVVTVTHPDGHWQRSTYGNKYRETEGKLLLTEMGTGTAVLTSTAHIYQLEAGGMSYPSRWGQTAQTRSDAFAEKNTPLKMSVTTRQGREFTWQVDATCGSNRTTLCFDALARPTKVTKRSEPAP